MNKMKIFKTFKEFSLVFLCQTKFSAPLCFQLFFRGNQFSRKSSAKDFVTDAFTCDSLYNCCSKSHRFQRGSLSHGASDDAFTTQTHKRRLSRFCNFVLALFSTSSFLFNFHKLRGEKRFH